MSATVILPTVPDESAATSAEMTMDPYTDNSTNKQNQITDNENGQSHKIESCESTDKSEMDKEPNEKLSKTAQMDKLRTKHKNNSSLENLHEPVHNHETQSIKSENSPSNANDACLKHQTVAVRIPSSHGVDNDDDERIEGEGKNEHSKGKQKKKDGDNVTEGNAQNKEDARHLEGKKDEQDHSNFKQNKYSQDHQKDPQESQLFLGKTCKVVPSFQTKEYEYGSESSFSTSDIPTPPDGGWGWVVVLGAFLCMVILDGMLFSFGVFFLDLLDYYGESKGKTAMVGSMLMGMHLFLGPVTSAMVNLWGIRAVTMLGGLIAGAAFTISVFAPNIEFLTFSYGLIGGFGVSMVYIPSILAVGFYFEKRRALANGITMAGSGIGTFIYAPLSNYLQDEYSWKGALMILSGIVLHCIVFGALYRPIRVRRKVKVQVQMSPSGFSVGEELSINNNKILEDADRSINASDLNLNNLKSVSHENIPKLTSTGKLTLKKVPESSSLYDINTSHRGHRHKHDKDESAMFKSANFLSPFSTRLHELRQNQLIHSQPMLVSNKPEIHHLYIHNQPLKPLERKDIFYSGSLYRIPQYAVSEEGGSGRGIGSMTQLEKHPEKFIKEMTRMSKLRELKRTFIQVAGLRLLKDPVFILVMLSSVLWTTHSTVLTILPDYSVEQGVASSKAAIILSMIGVTNVVGRIGSGWISDRPEIDVLLVNMSALYVGGAMCLCIPFSTNYSLLLTEAGVFGLCMATWTSLRPIVLVELLGIDNLTNAFGLLAMFQGAAFLVGPPMAGLFYDLTGSYTAPFLIAGLAFIISGLLIVPLRRLKSVVNRKSLVLDRDDDSRI